MRPSESLPLPLFRAKYLLNTPVLDPRYNVLVEAMGAVGLSEHEQHNVARVIAVVLMLGHVAFEETIGQWLSLLPITSTGN